MANENTTFEKIIKSIDSNADTLESIADEIENLQKSVHSRNITVEDWNGAVTGLLNECIGLVSNLKNLQDTISVTETLLNTKANTTYVNTELAKKADITYVNEGITDSISAHNKDENAHQDIRDVIDANSMALSVVDVKVGDIDISKVDKSVMYDTPVDIGMDITPSAIGVSITHNKKNIVTGVTSSEQDSMPIANGSQVGMMTPEQVEKIEDLESRVGGLEGQNVRLLYTASTNPTAAQIRQFVIDSGYTDTTKWSSIGVVIKDTNNIWRYYSNTQLWEDIGLDTVQQASQSIKGIVQGSPTNGKIFVESDGTMSLNGYDEIKDDIKDLDENKAGRDEIPTELSQLSQDSTHRIVTDIEKSTWNAKYTKPSTGIPESDLSQTLKNILTCFRYKKGDINGQGIAIGGGGSTVIGGGESSSLFNNWGGAEEMIISNDNSIEFYSNCQNGIGSAKKMVFDSNGNLNVPGNVISNGSVGGAVDINIENGEGQDSIKQKMTDDEERENEASGKFASAFGHGNKSSAKGTFVAGGDSEASADHSAAIGFRNRATKGNALALGCRTTATGDSAVSQGYSSNQAPDTITDSTPISSIRAVYNTSPFTLAQRYGSHAKGQNTVAYSQNSTAEGQGTFAFGDCQHAFGKFNEHSDSKSQLVRVTGWGSSNTNRKNIEELDRDGTLDVMGMPKTKFSVLTARFMKKYPMLFNCVSFVPKSWTADQWDNGYGKLGRSDVAWSGTNHLTKEIEGTFFALYGTTFDHADYVTEVVWYKKHIAIVRSTGGNPTDPTDSRASGQVIAKYEYLKGSYGGGVESGKDDLFDILELQEH